MYSKFVRNQQKKRLVIQLCGVLLLILAIALSLSQLKVIQNYLPKASSYPANIQIDTTAILGTMPRPWRNLSQGGESHAWRIQPITQQVAALNPEYIRLDHIYDFYDIVSGSPGNLQFDFTKLDLVLGDIKRVGAIPFISLSYMPPALSNGDLTGRPANYEDWSLVVQKTIQHISGTLGFSDVYYEVWNEPDLFGQWKYYGNKNYLDLYAASARGAARAGRVNAYKLGGPATTALYENWTEALLDYAQTNNVRLDFLSWHRYTNDLDQFRTDMSLARELVSQYPRFNGIIEYQITEWGHDSDNNSGYDSRYGAAHTIAGALTMVGVLQRGFVFEIQDGKDPEGKEYWGRWGLLTAPEFGSKSKPRYHALRMLDSIGNQRLQLLGQGSFVKGVAALSEDGAVETVLANFDPRGSNREVVPILYQNIEPGNYQLQTKYLSGQNQTIPLATTAAVLQVVVPMQPNDVAFVKLLRQ